MKVEKETSYELIYTDFLERRQVQDAIKTKEEAFRRKSKYYNSVECDSVIKKVVKTYKGGECTNIKKTTILK